MEIVARISKGSRMDQIYLPKNRVGFSSGQYVMIMPLREKSGEKKDVKPYFYGIWKLEPIKLEIARKIFDIFDDTGENIIITGSFLEKGFRFNDIDILVVGGDKRNIGSLRERIKRALGIKCHLIFIGWESLVSGLASDPLYSLMLSRCISKNRIIFNIKRKIDYKLLDFQLLKSKTLINGFELLNGDEKYYLTMNMIAILLFIKKKKLDKDRINRKIEEIFNVKVSDLRANIIEKKGFVKKYKEIYDKTFRLIIKRLK